MFYPKCLNNSNIYTIIIACSNKNQWMKYVYVVGFVLIKYMLNKSYEELMIITRNITGSYCYSMKTFCYSEKRIFSDE